MEIQNCADTRLMTLIKITVLLCISFLLCGCKKIVVYVYLENPPIVSTDKTILYEKKYITEKRIGDTIVYYCTDGEFRRTLDSVLASSMYVIDKNVFRWTTPIYSIHFNGYGDTIEIVHYDENGDVDYIED